MKNMTMNKITAECARCVQSFGEELSAMNTLVTESKKAVIFNVELRLCRIEFVLTTKNSVMCPVGTLFARIFPQKNRSLSLHLYELMGEDDFRCSYFPYNCSPEQVQLSFSVLSAMVREILPGVEQLALDSQRYDALLAEKCAVLAEYANVETDTLRVHLSETELQQYLFDEWGEFYETFAQLLPFTQSDAYSAFVAGDIAKALKKYRKSAKKGNLPPYFERLYAFLQTPQAHTFRPLPQECGAQYLQGREQQYGTKGGLHLLAAMGVLYPLLMLLFYLIAGGVYALVSAGASYMPFDGVFIAILSLLPAVFGALSLRRWLFPRLFRKGAERWLAQDELENSVTVNKVCHFLFGLTAAIGLFFVTVFTLSATRFYTDRMVYDDGSRFPLLNPVTYAYEDVDQVYYIEGRINTFDELVERGSYVLVFEDGTVIDLDSSVSVAQTEKYVLSLLSPYIDGITTYATDLELAEHYGRNADEFFGYYKVTW